MNEISYRCSSLENEAKLLSPNDSMTFRSKFNDLSSFLNPEMASNGTAVKRLFLAEIRDTEESPAKASGLISSK